MLDRTESIENHPMRGIAMNKVAVQSAYDAVVDALGDVWECIYAEMDVLDAECELEKVVRGRY